MKKLLSLTLLAAMLFAITACGNRKEDTVTIDGETFTAVRDRDGNVTDILDSSGTALAGNNNDGNDDVPYVPAVFSLEGYADYDEFLAEGRALFLEFTSYVLSVDLSDANAESCFKWYIMEDTDSVYQEFFNNARGEDDVAWEQLNSLERFYLWESYYNFLYRKSQNYSHYYKAENKFIENSCYNATRTLRERYMTTNFPDLLGVYEEYALWQFKHTVNMGDPYNFLNE